ncbi:predicted protein [Lichtheimia corymbifera JMRC:FSU:9682]|uniref:Phytanoyl-CoA dioxygenase family protein n=1 Tax=Lichtheimia corymbifera JMRC:FSU:9682 TaxID=1263082 RepID=A0A068RMF4_9FUNG|nr:predicted protein [Lichtheimia corymbifera JMRC:FSU:9682]
MVSLEQSHLEHFGTHGYTILYNALTHEQLEALYNEAEALVNYLISEDLDINTEYGCVIEPLTCGILDPPESASYKTNPLAYQQRRNQILDNDIASSFILGSLAKWAASLLHVDQDVVYLMNEQFIVKPPRTSDTSQFKWHQDSEYLDRSLRNERSIACWIALDDVDQHNGTILLGDPEKEQEATPVCIPAGSIVFMSDQLYHKSTGNASGRFRRVFMPQYSKVPMIGHGNGDVVGLAVPCDLLP